jgi:beta-glucanase (GH16 family)
VTGAAGTVRRMKRLAYLLAGALMLAATALATASPASAVTWALAWSSANASTGFAAVPVPLGGFSDCNHNPSTSAAVCLGLPASLQQIWWAYPDGWPDTATQRNLPVHGYYRPQDTVWISNGVMHIKMFRNAATGFNESAAVLPMKAFALTYGKFVERWKVSKTGMGFKSAHLLYPLPAGNCCENDFPEADWDGVKTVHAYSHSGAPGPNQATFDTGVPFNATAHTSTITWTPGSITFLLDGVTVGQVTAASGKVIPSDPLRWVIQNESALDGEQSALGQSAQMDITQVKVYTCSAGC